MRLGKVLSRKNPWSDKDVEAHWDSISSIYIEENNKVKKAHDQRFKKTIDYLSLKPNQQILNISSRDCEANDYIAATEPSARVINAEISAGLIKVALKIRPYVNTIKLETYSSLPFENESFDRIVCLETLEHVQDPIRFLNELNRVAKKSSRMVLSCPPATSELPYRIFTLLFGGHGEGPHRFLPSKEVKALFQQTNWKLEVHKGTLLIPVGPYFFQNFGEWLINIFQKTFISELGIRQFYVCTKA